MGKHLAFDTEAKRPWQVTSCPADFAETFVREGWRGVEAKYGFHTRTNKRLIEQAGGEALRQRRTEFLKARMRAAQPKNEPVAPPSSPPPSRVVLSAIAFLRSPDGGNWAITSTGEGDFYFGCTRLSGQQLVDRARRKGWDGSGDLMTIARTMAFLRD